jgi:hypothetical protein
MLSAGFPSHVEPRKTEIGNSYAGSNLNFCRDVPWNVPTDF